MLILNKYKSNNYKIQSNEDFLISQVWNLKHIFFNEISAIKNIGLEYLAFSEPFAEAFKFNQTMLGKVSAQNSKIDKEIIQQEQEILLNMVQHDSVYQFKCEQNIDTYIMRKRPLINPASNECVGLLILAAKADITFRRRLMLKHFIGGGVSYSSILPQAELTKQQQEIITCLLLGFQQRKEIAAILESVNGTEYSERKVKQRLEELYQQFNCTSLHELMDLVVINYQEQIPFLEI